MSPTHRSCLIGVLLSLSGCAGAKADPASGANAISGSIQGTSWSKLSRAYWLGKPSRGSSPFILFLFDSPVECAALVNPNWDKTLSADTQSLEIDLLDSEVRVHDVGNDVAVAYLKGFYNPDADAGSVTLDAVNDAQNIAGNFDLTFGADALNGKFDALYCAEGVEP